MVICTIIGTRPQFIKHAAVVVELNKHKLLSHFSIHTGQHYDPSLSQQVFDDLRLAQPDYQLDIGSHSHARQTAMMMLQIERIFNSRPVDCLIVYGDSNSTLAGVLVAKKKNIRVAHIEAGLRSFNMSMPEEVNRIVTDKISDLLFAPSQTAVDNLKNESVFGKIIHSGDVMKDLIQKTQIDNMLKLTINHAYVYATIHRHYNTDDPKRLSAILAALNQLSFPVIFSLHPRTKHYLHTWSISVDIYDNIKFIDPPAYVENLRFISHANVLITDSGGMQKEAYWLKKKCITLRPETEWLETLSNGWNTLIYDSFDTMDQLLGESPGIHDPALYGHGNAAQKIVDTLMSI